jgi:hypothetical protein
MAEAKDLEVKLTIERMIHDGVADVLRQIETDHGIVVEEIFAEWVDISTMEQPRAVLRTLAIRTSTKFPGVKL